jgi:DinB superfamily
MVSAFLGSLVLPRNSPSNPAAPARSVDAVRRWNEQLIALPRLLWFALSFYRKPEDDQIDCGVLLKVCMDKFNVIVAALERAPEIVLPLVLEVPETILKRRPRPGKWSAHEHACHLATVHPVMLARLNLMLTERRPSIVSYFPSTEEEEGSSLKLNLEEEMQRFSRDRQKLVERLKTLSPADWERTAGHDEYTHYSVFIMFRHLAMHDMFHAYRIEELLLKNDWE